MKKYFKKSLSLFMAALMLMSCWVFFAPTAEAVSAGKYKVRLEIDSGNDTGGWNYGKVGLYGKNNNGKGSEKRFWYAENHLVNFNGKVNWYEDETDYFPTKFVYEYSFGGGMTWREMKFTVRIYVNGIEVASEYHSAKSSAFSAAKGTKTTTVGTGNYPKANSVVFDADPGTINAPGSNSSAHYHLNDQYGVRVSSSNAAPSVSVKSNKTIADGSLTVSNNNNDGSYSVATIKATEGVKQKDVDSQTGTLSVSYKFNGVTKSGSKNFTINDPQYTFSFNGNGGSISPNASVKKYYYNTLSADQIPSSGTRTGYEFLGVYAAAHVNYDAAKPAATAYGNRLTTGTPIEKNQTWYAAWWAKNVKVTFVDNMGNILKTVETGKYDKNVKDSGITTPTEAPFKRNTSTGTFNYDFNGNWKVIEAKDINGNEVQGAYGTSIAGNAGYVLKGDTVFQAQYDKSKNSYNVKFLDEGGNVINGFDNDFPYRGIPTQPSISKAEDNNFNYTFKGWHLVADGEQAKGYIVNSNGLLSTSATSDSADAGNKYISTVDDFTVRAAATYVPVFEKTYNEYTVTLSYKTATGEEKYFNNNGKTYHFGDTLGLPEVPDSYTFGGNRYPLTGFTKNGAATGSKDLPTTLGESVTTHATKTVNYVATYGAGVAARYNISFTYKKTDGTDGVSKINDVPHGRNIGAPQVPTTYRDAEYEYTFSKWLDQDGADFKSPAYKDAQYTAQYTAKKLYTVTFMNEGEEFAEKAQYVAGDTIAMPSTNPTKPADKTAYKYTFKEWVDSEGAAVTVMPEDNLVLEASYTPSYIDYVINFVWKDKNGNDVTDTNTYHYGDAVTVPDLEEKGQTSYKDNTYEYTFKGWDTDVSKRCLGEGEMNEDGTSATLTYTATYRRAYNYYTVKWQKQTGVINGEIQHDDYMTDAFIYNEKVRIPTVAPVSIQKPEKGDAYSMVLDHWAYKDENGEFVAIDRDTRITGNIEFFPIYKEVGKTCTVSFYDYLGNSLGQAHQIEYNTNLETYDGIGAPRRNYSDEKHFRFDGWVDMETGKKVTFVTDDCKLKATYVEEAHDYDEVVADVLPTFFETGLGTKTCKECAKSVPNQIIEEIADTKKPTAKLFVKNAKYESDDVIPEEALPVAPKNNLIIATVDSAESTKYNESGKGSGTAKIEYYVSKGESALAFDEISGWLVRFDYDAYVKELKDVQKLTDDEIKLAMSEFEANATAYVGDLANSYPEIVKDGETFIFYAKITDRKGNVNYVRSQPLTFDATAPEITAEGSGNGGSKFCKDVVVKIVEDRAIDSVTVNGKEQELSATTVVDADGNEKVLDIKKAGEIHLSTKGVYTIVAKDESGNVTEKTIEILGSHTEKETVTAATCTDKGKTTYTCTVCGEETKTADETEPLGHDFKFIKTVKKTCIDKGYDLYRCTRCGLTKEDNIDPPTGDHTYGDWIVTKKATCSATGSEYKICSECGNTVTQDIAIDTDAHVWYRGVVTKPTCTEGGYTMHKCKYCGLNVKVEGSEVPALGHEAGDEWFVVKEATCTEAGSKIHHCSRCDIPMDATLAASESKAEYDTTTEIKALGHNYVGVVTPPTATEQGYTTYTCSRCGDNYVDEYVDPAKTYTVTFYDENGTTELGKVDGKISGETVSSSVVEEPTKAADKTYKYTFSHWALKADEENKAVEFPVEVGEENIELKAVYAKKYINYMFVFYTETKTDPVEEVQFKKVGYLHYDNKAQEFAGPSDYETKSATYKFAGWVVRGEAPIIDDVLDENGDVLQKSNVSKSIKVSDVKFDADNTAEFVAVFKATVKKVNFTYAYDYDNVIYSTKVDYGTEFNVTSGIPEDVMADVHKDFDNGYHYSFKEWKVRDGAASVKPLEADGLAIAQFTATAHNIVDDDEKADLNKAATCTEDGVRYVKCFDCGYTGTETIAALGHAWGDEEDGLHHCTRPGCEETKESDTRYVVKFFIEGETEALRTVSGIKYGADITSRIPTPTKADNGSKTYKFLKWYKSGDESKTAVDLTKELAKITADAEYIAVFTEETKMCKVIYRVDGSTVALQVTEVEYGTKTIPEYTGEAPASDKYDDYGHYVWYEEHPWSVEQTDIPAEGITKDLVIVAQFISEDHEMEATTMHNATCTEPMEVSYKCAKCEYTYTKKTGKPLGHNFTDLVERVEPVGEKAGYEIYKCTRCGETERKELAAKEYINFVVTVIDTKGNPVEGAKVSIFDGDTFVASNTTNKEGKVTFRVEKAKKYRVVIEGSDFDTVYGDITVNPDGSTSGDIPQPNIKACSCTCHRNGVWPAIFRFFHKIIKMLVGEFVCCGNPDSRYYK